ncbi:MAG: ATP-binding protein [bacterium]
MNLNKLFKQFKIRRKLTIAFTVLATVPMLLTGFFGLKYTVAVLEKNSLQQLNSSISTMQVKVDRFLNEAKSDIFYLSDSFVFRQFLESFERHEKSPVSKQVLLEQLADFAENRGRYYQLRFLDRYATEILRIERDSVQTVIVPDEELTKRQDVFYLYHIENTTERELLYTPVELRDSKLSHNVVPAISYFLPVYSDSKERGLQGIFIANVYAQKLFEILSEEPLEPGRTTILADNKGYYLYNSARTEWNRLLALRKEGNVANDFSAAIREKILSGKAGLIDGDLNKIIAYTPIFFTGSADNYMVLFQCVSKDLVRKPIKSFVRLVATIGSFTFAMALLLGFLGANQFTKPIKALSKSSEMLAAGELDYRIEIDTNDEIEQLANDFNRMADDIKKHEEQLQEYAEELEARVRERTRELSKALSYLQNLIDSSIDAIITLDNKQIITYFSKGAETILGFRADEVLDKEICSLCKSCLFDDCPIRGVSEQRTILKNQQLSFLDRHGQPVPLNVSVSPIKNEQGEMIGVLTIGKDLREQKKMEQQIQQAEKLAGIGQLAAGMAHQLNTPVASIILSAQMVKDMITDEEILEDISKIERQADHCKKLIQDLLSFSRPSKEHKSAIVLQEVIEVTVRMVQKEFSNRDIHIITEFDKNPREIHGNENQIEQLFFNLLKNAEDAMPAGGEIRIRTARDGNQSVKVTVADTGIGMKETILSKIFEPFFTTKDVGRGTGLGLSVCYGIVEEHGGNIEVESEPGKGTTFTIRLPLMDTERTP